MTALVPPVVADDVYLAKLEPRRRGPVRRVVGAVLDLWCAMSGGLLELTSAADVVVRRRSDDTEDLRVFAGPPSNAANVLDQVRSDLRALSADKFRRAWGVGGSGG